MEVVATEALAEITSRTSLLTSSIGAGPAGDIIFLFTEDITGENPTPPRRRTSEAATATRRLERTAFYFAFQLNVRVGEVS